MTAVGQEFGSFEALLVALGILKDNGDPNSDWFSDPLGNSSANDNGLKTILGNDDQRRALESFVDDVLGAPDRSTRGGVTWVPLFRESSPQVTIYATLKPVTGAVQIGLALEHAMQGSAPSAATSVHVPLFRVPRGSASLTGGGTLPPWLLLGRAEGKIEISVDLTLRSTPPVPGDASLGGLAVSLGIPTDGSANLALAMTLRELQLPGSTVPRTMVLDAATPDALGGEVLELLATLVRAQMDALANAVPAQVSGVLGLLGLRNVPGLPALPLADIATRGVDVLVEWLREVFASNTPRTVWLTQLQQIIGGATATDRVTVTTGALSFSVGVRSSTGTGGALSITPFLSLALTTGANAQVALAVDLLRADLATGMVTAVPDLRAEALFGDQAAGGAALLTTGATRVGGVRTGLVLRADRRAALTLTLHNVTVAGRSHPLLDLSSPDAAVDAAESVVTDAIAAALDEFGEAGALIATLLGLEPPGALSPINAAALLADPLAEVMRYWQALTGSSPAMSEALGALRRLLMNTPLANVPGAGTRGNPWRVELTSPLVLLLWRDGGSLVVDAAISLATPVFDGNEVVTTLRGTLLRLQFSPAQVTFVGEFAGSVELRHPTQKLSLELGPLLLSADALRLLATWSPTRGLLVDVEAPNALATLDGFREELEFTVPLPLRNAITGALEFPDTAWDGVQSFVTALASQARVPMLGELLQLVGWTGNGPVLALSTLVAGDPALAIREWLALLALDCDHVRDAMSVVARVLSAGAVREATGSGSVRDPYRAAIAGDLRAPALAAWLEPPCPPRSDFGKTVPARRAASVTEDGESIAQRLRNVATSLPEIDDLLTGRDSLGVGIDALVTRWTNTDGITPVPVSITGGVTIVARAGSSYDDLVADGAHGLLVPTLVSPVPATVIHVGSEPIWRTDRPAGRAVDASSDSTTGSITAAGTGEWFVLLPTPVAAAAMRSDRDGVAEQAARLDRVLAARTGAVTIVAYGPCAAAVLRVAQTRTTITQVITVGAPFVTPSVSALRSGLGADALRLLERLVRSDVAPLPPDVRAVSATSYDVVRDLLARSLMVAREDAALPSAGAEAIRSGLTVRAVFGALDEDTIRRGIAAIVEDGIHARFEALRAAAMPLVPREALHVGADVPVLSANIGGLFVGVGATFDLVQLKRDAVQAFTVATERSVTVHVHFGVTDGWLIGGPSPEPSDVSVRWMSAHVTVPFDGGAGDTEFVLHEARGLGVFRERWVVRADGDGTFATAALPEVRAILSAIIARLRAASPALNTLLDVAGLLRDGGLDTDGLDRLLFEPQTVAAQVRARAEEAAASIQALVSGVVGAVGSSALTWTIGDVSVGLDIGTRTFSAALNTVVAESVPCALSLALSTDRSASVEFALGAFDPNAGGVRLVGRGGASNTMMVEWRGAGSAPLRTMALLPTPNVASLRDFASTVAPAFLTQALVTGLRDRLRGDAWSAFSVAMDAIGMFHDADLDGFRRVRLPVALFDDVSAWLANGTAPWRSDPLGQAVALLETLAPIVAPGRAVGATSWPIVPGVLSVNYVVTGNTLNVALNAAIASTVDGAEVSFVLGAGLAIARDLRVSPALSTSVTVDGTGLSLVVAPTVQLSLVRPAPAAVLMLYPAGAGLASVLGAIGESVVPPVLNALAARRTDAGSALIKRVGTAVFDLGGALDLRNGTNFTAAKLSTFSADPAGALLARMPNLVGLGVAALSRALDESASVVSVDTSSPGVLHFRVGTTNRITLTLDTTVSPPVMKFGGTLAVPAIGNIVVEELRLASDGVSISVRFGPASLNVGGVILRPVLVVRAGVTRSGFTRLAALGLGVDAAGVKSAEVRWALDATPPTFAVVTRTAGIETLVNSDPAQFALSMLSIGASIATGLALPVLDPPGGPAMLPPQAFTALERVLFVTTGGVRSLDVSFFDDLLLPQRLFDRAKRLLWNIATQAPPISVTIDGALTIALAALPAGGTRKRLGVTLSLASPTSRVALVTGDPTVELETFTDWITGSAVPAGITITMLEGEVTAGGTVALDLVPSFTAAGVGLRFSKSGGPLLNLGDVSLDAIAVHILAEVSSAGVGGGVNIELAGFAIAPSSAGGNPVAGGILADASTGSPSNRPAFSPSVAVQQRAGGSLGLSVTAGRPPGPWWLIVQRELGPLYLEQLGFDSTTTNGQITRFSLLFDGRVSIFGMTAAVDQLSLTWTGGDVFEPSSWSADLRGLAVAANFSGLTIAGGLLKDGENGYLGMLLGRFAAYGITVYGGYAVIDSSPSFFIFGALNGPIGGPPAFFVTGIGAGLGINRMLRVPDDLSQFGEYPFIKALDVAATVGNPMDELKALNQYFKPQPGQFWVAAGISFTSFALVDGIAVLAVSFGTNGLDINLLGLARMALPRPGVALVSIELALLARFSMSEGVFSIRAQLTENSWLLYEDVRLTGGFAFAVWWKGPLAGQFVLTIGGYYPGFHRDGYPDVPRLGLTWQVTDDIVIKGGAYFALTSEALMAGVDVIVSADFGWAWAKIEFGGHAIVYFDPFWFEASAYARISAGVRIRTFLGTVRFSLSTGATLLVNGPDFGGRARFEVGPASVTVPFGSQNKTRGDVIDWPAFVTKYLEDGASGGARALSAITGLGTLPRKAGGNPADSADGSRTKPYEVFGEFELTISSTAPIVTAGTTVNFITVQPTRPDGAAVSLGLAPMGKSSLVSNLALSLQGISSEPDVGGEKTAILAQFFPKAARENEAYPIGVWGAPNILPIPAIPKGDVLSALTRVRFDFRTAGLINEIPPIKYRHVEFGRTALPLQARGGVRVEMFTKAGTIAVPAPTTVNAALTRASATLFAAQPQSIPQGLLPRGDAGAAAKAAFRGDRVAPPIFGNLTDGLRRTNAADGVSSPAPVAPIAVAPLPRAPKVTGVLAGGVGVIERGLSTTVLDQSLKRRSAPTLDSARTRLTGRSLPVQLARTPRPGEVTEGTIISAGAVPFTAAPGTRRSMAVGRSANGVSLDSLVGGLKAPRKGARTSGAQSSVHAGDLVVLASPDASIDLETKRRPTLVVSGQARVTMVESDGTVLVDATVADKVTVPPKTAMIGVQAGGSVAVDDGLLRGWHARTRVARLSAKLAVAPGCALIMEGAVVEGSASWMEARTAIDDASAITTRFSATVRTVVVVLTGAAAPNLDGITLELRGATRSLSNTGTVRAPMVVVRGPQSVLVYEVIPERGATNVSVRVLPGGQWQFAGVMGSDVDVSTVAQSIALRGVVACAGRLLMAADGRPITVQWAPASAPVNAAPRKSSAAKRKAETRKSGARASTARSATTSRRGGTRNGN
jgi:large repetitive protein